MGLEASGMEIGVVKSPEEMLADLAVEENWYGKPLWEKKFKTWQILTERSCPAKKGQGGRYCSWVGFACHYNGCPRRIFEEYVATEEVKRPEPTPDFVAEFRTLQKKFGKMQKQLNKANDRIKELEDEKKED